jgi:serine protease Do
MKEFMKRRTLVAALVGAGLLAGAAGAWSASNWFHSADDGTPSGVTPVSPAAATASPAPAPIGPVSAPNYRAIVQRFGPAVVGITTEGMSKARLDGDDTDAQDDPFFQFFRGLPGFQFHNAPRNNVPTRGQASGFIISRDGLILTNAHVVRDADTVTVKLSDRHEYKAKVLGSDTATDIAVLKINASNLPIVSLGNPAQLGVGDYVLAIGSPFGFEQSATAGIVSAKGRSLPGDGFVPFIQTDVAVNPGNSGGPLFDANGAVVGINSQIYSQTGGYEGVSFAIPIDVALRVQEQIVKTGKAVHAQLGVTIQDLTQSLSNSFGLPKPDGALVSNVLAGSPAASAGIEPGDVILSFNGQAITRSGDLPALVAGAKPGDKARFDIWRGGKKLSLSATLSEAGGKRLTASNRASPARQGRLGVAVRPLTAEERRESGLASGVLVEQVGGAAARAGIASGDVILAVNGTAVKSAEQLQALVAKEREHVALLIQRGDDKVFVPVPLG